MAPYPATSDRQSAWHDLVTILPGSLVLVLACMGSGVLGALVTFRLLLPPPGPTLWHLFRMLFSHAVGR
ncbi:MAG TPA: hypothetical protein VHQ90_10425 [Thermoanaerobaculia bacterium]|nr:hypothetical protein [Thermoanaerobaculia bacterium]